MQSTKNTSLVNSLDKTRPTNSASLDSSSYVSLTPEQIGQCAHACLTRIRSQNPKVHCITNVVAANTVANVLLAIGAEPSMTANANEVRSFVASAQGLSVNLGTLNAEHEAGIIAAVSEARKRNIVWQLDPVFVHRVPSRHAFARSLIDDVPTVIRGNQAEISTLLGVENQPACFSQIVMAVTGACDRIYLGHQQTGLLNGHPLMSQITATGCAASALITAFVAVEADVYLATCAALAVLGISGEIAARDCQGPASLQIALIDTLHHIHDVNLASHIKMEDKLPPIQSMKIPVTPEHGTTQDD